MSIHQSRRNSAAGLLGAVGLAIVALAAPTGAAAVTPISADLKGMTGVAFPSLFFFPARQYAARHWDGAGGAFQDGFTINRSAGYGGGGRVETNGVFSTDMTAAEGDVGVDLRFIFDLPTVPGAGFFAGDDATYAVWSYTFKADGDGQIDLDYDFGISSNLDGYNGFRGWSIGWSGSGETYYPGAVNTTTSGTFSGAIEAGQTYTIWLSPVNNLNTSGLSGPRGLFNEMTSNFHYAITESAVPEPTTWALMIAGFGLTGAALRRRRRAELRA